MSILDVGCGTGSRIIKIVKHLNTSIVYGIDISDEMVKIANKNNLQADVADIVSLNVENKNFDAVLCLFNCLGYLDTYKKRVIALQNMNTHMKEGGILFIDVMNVRHKGEGITFKRSTKDIFRDFLPLFDSSLGFGNKRFTLNVNNKKVAGFVHGFYNIEMQWMLTQSGFTIFNKYIIGYDSGELKSNVNEGQLFYICQKK